MAPVRGPPVIDFADFLSGDERRVQKCAQEIREACMTEGFFQIINHGVPSSLMKEILDMSKEFFNLPLEEKMKLDKSQNAYNRGYQRVGSQIISKEAQKKPDLMEGFYVGRELPPDHPQVEAGKFGSGPNLWPTKLGQPFQETCMLYLHHMIEVAEQLLKALAVSLGYEKNFFNEFCKDPMTFYKMLHYPPAPPDDAAELQQGLGSHRDFGCVTLLLQDGVPGLEYWDKTGKEWVPVQPVKDALVINLGNMFMQWTNDLYESVVHRVINTTGAERYSIPFNFNGNPDFVISCLEKCRDRVEDEKYSPVTVEDFIRPQYSVTYGRTGHYQVATATTEK
ncbi:MFS transporter [Xylaria digitata]|nr:MFS transporter [Xylaria digitata]